MSKRTKSKPMSGIKAVGKVSGKRKAKKSKTTFKDAPRPKSGELIVTPGSDGSVSYRGRGYGSSKASATTSSVRKIKASKQVQVVAQEKHRKTIAGIVGIAQVNDG